MGEDFFTARPPQTYLSGKKIESQKRGGDNQNAQYISLSNCY